jgi:hypothetical protein
MAVEYGDANIVVIEAGADLSAAANLYKFVKFSSGKIDVCSSATDIPVGVLQNRPSLGMGAEVLVFGISKVRSDANLAQGDLIGTAADGEALALVAGTDTTKYVVGRVLFDTSGAAGDYTAAFINCLSPHRAA